MGAPRSKGGFDVHRNDIDALAAYVDQITPISGIGTSVDDSPTGKGRAINAAPPAPPSAATAALDFPFDVIAPDNPGDSQSSAVYAQVNVQSLFALNEYSTDDITVANIGVDFALQAGMYVYLQVDTANGIDINEVSVVWNTIGFGDDRIKIASGGDSYLWDQSFLPLAQVFENTDGEPAHGGTIFASGDGKNTLEVVNLCSSHLGAVGTIVDGVLAQAVIKTAVAFDFAAN